MTGLNPDVVHLSGGNLVLIIIVALIALGALAMAAMFRNEVLAAGEGTDNMKNIAQAVQEGANAYLQRQFRTLFVFAGVAFVVLLALPADDIWVRIFRSVFFLVGGRILGHGRLPRHVPGGEGQPARRGSRRDPGPRPGDDDRLPHRRHGGHAHRRPRTVRGRGRRDRVRQRGAPRAGGLRLRRRAAGDVHACRRRHLHQGRRRRRRPGRQGREQHPRGRPAQRGHDRRQRGRQRGRLRGHGGRPLRVLRRDPGRGADPRLRRLRREGPRVPAADPRDRRADRGARRLPLQAAYR